MLETPGRKLFRAPFSLNPKTIPTESISEGTQATHLPEANSIITDAETREMPQIDAPTSHNRAIAEVETRKIPSWASHFHRNSTLADLETFKIFSFPKVPSHASGTVAEHNKTEQEQASLRKKIVLLVFIVVLLFPTCVTLFEIINGVVLSSQLWGGITHLQNATTIFHGNSSGGSGLEHYFDRVTLLQAQEEIDAAHANFMSMSDKLDHGSTVSLLSYLWSPQVNTLRALGHIAVAGTASAHILIGTAVDIAPSMAPGIQQAQSKTHATAPLKPYLTSFSFQKIMNALNAIKPYVHDMSINASGLSLNGLPFSDKQREMILSILPLLPALDAVLSQEHKWSEALKWFLGIDQKRSFLIEPMDRAELRATGGFTGQFGDLILNGAHIGPLHLENIGKFEEDHTSEGSPPDQVVYEKVVGQSAPAPYSQWWPIPNFGLRDSNISADFPTSAKIAMDRYAYEFGTQVDGVLLFTPSLIEHVLDVTGPITILGYHETISAQNLQQRLHYYQLDNTGIRHEEIVEQVEDPQVARKLFTQRVTTTLISTVTHLPLNKLFLMVSEMFRSMKSKDLQVYVNNPQVEALIGMYGSTGSLDRSNNHDGLFIVQSNLSASKASQYVTTRIRDMITIDANGGATHHLKMTLDYQKKGDVYGFDTYYDYVRVYVPVHSQLLMGEGFDQYNRPYCGDAQSIYTMCQPDVYGNGALVCVPPISLGLATSYISDPYAGRDHPLNIIGPPQYLQSDEEGRGMFGGWVIIPKNCRMTVTLSWYVPPMGQHPYNLLLQAQADVYAPLDLTIVSDEKACKSNPGHSLHISRLMNGEDLNFAVEQHGSRCVVISS